MDARFVGALLLAVEVAGMGGVLRGGRARMRMRMRMREEVWGAGAGGWFGWFAEGGASKGR